MGGLIIVAGSLNPELEGVLWFQRLAGSFIVYPFLADFLQRATLEMLASQEQVERLEPRLARIRCPMVVIHWTADKLVPFEAAEFTVELFADKPRVFVIVLIGEGHTVTKERDEELRETIEELRDGLVHLRELPY